MGIGGHMLGERKLRRLAMLTGLPLDRAYNRNGYCEGRTPDDRHWLIDPETGESEQIVEPMHWTSCKALIPQPGGRSENEGSSVPARSGRTVPRDGGGRSGEAPAVGPRLGGFGRGGFVEPFPFFLGNAVNADRWRQAHDRS